MRVYKEHVVILLLLLFIYFSSADDGRSNSQITFQLVNLSSGTSDKNDNGIIIILHIAIYDGVHDKTTGEGKTSGSSM